MYKAIINKLNQMLAKANKEKFHAFEFSDRNFKDGEIKALEDALAITESLQRAEFEFFWTPDPRNKFKLHCNRSNSAGGSVYVGSVSCDEDLGRPYDLSIRLLDRDVEKACMGASLEDAKNYIERKHTELFNRIQAYLNGEDY